MGICTPTQRKGEVRAGNERRQCIQERGKASRGDEDEDGGPEPQRLLQTRARGRWAHV